MCMCVYLLVSFYIATISCVCFLGECQSHNGCGPFDPLSAVIVVELALEVCFDGSIDSLHWGWVGDHYIVGG